MREVKYKAWDKRRNCWIEDCDLLMESSGRVWAGDINNPPPVRVDSEFVVFSTGLKDKNGVEIFEGHITELEVGGEVRRFVVNIKTVIREVVSHPAFADDTAKVAITGVVFEWNGFELFPCVNEKGEFDNSKMVVVGNIYEHSHLLNKS